jgi:membrane protease YdiL (CAAX protease family)
LVAFGFAGLNHGKAGVKELLLKLTKWKINILWYLFSVFYMFFVFYVPALICNLFGEYYTISQRYPSGQLLMLFLGQLFAGPLNEEFGWRGFLLPKCQEKYSPLVSSLLVGFIHGLWHLPLFLFYLKEPLPLYLFKVVCVSILYTWMYNHSKGSLLPVCLLHAFYNFVSVPFTMQETQSNAWYLIISNFFALAPVLFAAGTLLRDGRFLIKGRHEILGSQNLQL